MENKERKQLAQDLASFEGITYEEALYRLGFTPDFTSIWLGSVQAAERLGVRFTKRGLGV